MTKPVNIMITDDHSMIREGLKQLLELDGDIAVVGEANDGLECIKMLDYTQMDLLILDINMPNMNGLKVLEFIRDRKMDLKVLILTIHNEVEYLMKAIEIGVDGYVLKDSESHILKKAIFNIHRGEKYIQTELLPLLNSKREEKRVASNSTFSLLTVREIEVIKLLAQGLFNKEIAYTLNISEKTVKNHVSNIFKKIDVADRTQAAVYAIKNNIVEI